MSTALVLLGWQPDLIERIESVDFKANDLCFISHLHHLLAV